MINSVIRTQSTARIFLVCIYLLNYFINRKFPAVKQSVFLLDRKFSIMWHGSKVLWNETRGRKFHGTFVPGNESSRGRNFVPGDESFRERKFHRTGTFVPGDESSTLWNFRLRGRKFLGTKVPDTVAVYITRRVDKSTLLEIFTTPLVQ